MCRRWLGTRTDPWGWLRQADPAELPLFEAGLLMACDAYPDLDPERYLDRFDTHVQTLQAGAASAASAIDGLRLLNRYLFDQQGFSGNFLDYYDPRNSYLHEVLDRKLGIPISLSVLYMELGQRLGLKLEGVSFPGHFLVRLPVDGGLIVLDPFHGGKSVGAEELKLRARNVLGQESLTDADLRGLLGPAERREVLVRMLVNLKGIYSQREEPERALIACDRLVQLTGDIAERRDRGLLYQAVGAHAAAAVDLEAYLKARARAEDADAVRAALIDARGRAARPH